jgi:MFS family permease
LVLLALFLCTSVASVLLRSPAGPGLFAGLILQGIASGSMMTLLILILVELPAVGERRAGTASGLFFSAAEIGGVGGPVMLGVLYDSTGSFGAGLGVLTVAGLLLAGSVLVLRNYVELPRDGPGS